MNLHQQNTQSYNIFVVHSFNSLLSIEQVKKNMENQNIQYRRLKSTKRGKTGKFSGSLLSKTSKLNKSALEKEKKEQFNSIMKRNVIQIQHLLKNPLLHLNQVDWVSRLREPIVSKDGKQEEGQIIVPSVFGKTTQAMVNRFKRNKIKQKGYNTADYQQMLSKKGINNHLPESILSFITGLRDHPKSAKVLAFSKVQQNKQQQQLTKDKKLFSTIPFKQRNQYPKFLTKQSATKLKSITNSNLESAFDGSQNYPQYSQKIVKEKNYGVLRTFTTGPVKSSLPTLAWQMGLRS